MRALLPLLALLLAVPPARAADPWQALRDGAVGLMRHGGGMVGDPAQPPPVPGCDTAFVLTELGREEMRRVGERLRGSGITGARVLTSRSCGAWETAVLLGIGPVEHNPKLDLPSPDQPEPRRDALQRALREAARTSLEGDGPVILVTHRANITDLTGIDLTHGEMLLLRPRPDRMELAGRVAAD